jgi:hypothetical protein
VQFEYVQAKPLSPQLSDQYFATNFDLTLEYSSTQSVQFLVITCTRGQARLTWMNVGSKIEVFVGGGDASYYNIYKIEASRI